MKVLSVEESNGDLEVHEIVKIEKRLYDTYIHTQDGIIYDISECVNEPKSACIGDFILIEDDGSVACEKKVQMETLLETLVVLNIPYTYA